jgi:hypothetical protein
MTGVNVITNVGQAGVLTLVNEDYDTVMIAHHVPVVLIQGREEGKDNGHHRITAVDNKDHLRHLQENVKIHMKEVEGDDTILSPGLLPDIGFGPFRTNVDGKAIGKGFKCFHYI